MFHLLFVCSLRRRVFTARYAKRGVAMASRPSLSVRDIRYRDHRLEFFENNFTISWDFPMNRWKIPTEHVN